MRGVVAPVSGPGCSQLSDLHPFELCPPVRIISFRFIAFLRLPRLVTERKPCIDSRDWLLICCVELTA